MKRKSFKQMNCSIARSLEVVGEWWSLLILRDAFLGLHRFEDFQASLGIARNVLAQRLRKLVSQGVLEKRRYQDTPPRYEYRLTPKGLDLFPVIVSLMGWGDRWAAGTKGPPVVLVDRDTGAEVRVGLADLDTGIPLDPKRLRARAGAGASADVRRRLGTD